MRLLLSKRPDVRGVHVLGGVCVYLQATRSKGALYKVRQPLWGSHSLTSTFLWLPSLNQSSSKPSVDAYSQRSNAFEMPVSLGSTQD